MSKKGRNRNKKSKKAQERLKAQKEQQKKIFFGVTAGIIVAIIVVGIVLLNWGKGDDQNNDDVYYQPPPVSNSGNIEISKADLSDGDFHYYEDGTGSEKVKYFMALGSDGEVHSAFDACEVCFDAKKGYSKSGDTAECNNCGQKFAINDLGTKNQAAGCWPGYLPQTTSGDTIIIDPADLKQGERLF